MLYGNAPTPIGVVDLNPTEMMFWMYCPISVPGMGNWSYRIPENLKQYAEIVDIVQNDYGNWKDKYVYITAKTLWVQGDYIGNRPGWHSDGFGTSDVNYIWYDRAPTEFLVTCNTFELSDDCNESIQQMEQKYQELGDDNVLLFANKTLLKLDPSVIHRCPVGFEPGIRTFVKITVSDDLYDLEGNSINHLIGDICPNKAKRNIERNHPSSKNR